MFVFFFCIIYKVLFKDNVALEVNAVFDDVSDEYSQMSSILDKFEEWRKNDMDTYKDTYFSLCLPKVSDI